MAGCRTFRNGHPLAAAAFWMLLTLPAGAQTVTIQQSPSGIVFSGASSPFHSGFGNVNGLGIGTAANGVTAVAVSGGEFYFTPYQIVVSGANNGHKAEVKAYVSPNFSTPSSVIQLMTCPTSSSCSSFSNFGNMPTTQATEVDVLAATTTNATFTAYLGLFIANTNGVAITNPDSATINFDIYKANGPTLLGSTVLKLDTPSESVQTAVSLQLATDTALSGLTIGPGGTTDYAANFGNVNGLGIAPGANLSILNGQVSNGSLYATPYLITPAFSGFTTTSGTTITVYSSGFGNPALLKLYDSGTSNSGYGLISTSSGSPTTMITAPSNGVNITRYLGLFVSNANGAGILGSYSAKLTYTITVQ